MCVCEWNGIVSYSQRYRNPLASSRAKKKSTRSISISGAHARFTRGLKGSSRHISLGRTCTPLYTSAQANECNLLIPNETRVSKTLRTRPPWRYCLFRTLTWRDFPSPHMCTRDLQIARKRKKRARVCLNIQARPNNRFRSPWTRSKILIHTLW